MDQPTIPIYFVNEVLLNLKDENERKELLAKNHIPVGLVKQLSSRITAVDYANLVRDSMHAQRDETLGHGTAPQILGSWEMMCHYAITSRNLGEALERCCRFYSLYDWGVQEKISLDGGRVTFSLESNKTNQIRPYLFESTLFYVYRLANWLITQEIPLSSVSFHFSAPAHANQHREMFLCKNINYDEKNTSITFNKGFLDYAIRQSLHSLVEFLKHPNRELIIQRFDQRSWNRRVRSMLSCRMDTGITFSDLADELAVHPQTLRRNLNAEGFRYKNIKEEVRRDNAIGLLRDESLSVEDIAFKIGFSDSSTFIRSFRNWTGVTPYSYRKNR